MIAVDTNILIYAHRRDSPFHGRAAECMRTLAEGAGSWALPWPCIHEFLAVATHPRIFSPPTRLEEGLEQIAAWLESPTVVLLREDADYWGTLRETCARAQVVGPRIHDARIAALCRHHRVTELWSADRDFSRFSGLVVRNPLVA